MFESPQRGDEARTHTYNFELPQSALLEHFAEMSVASDGLSVQELSAGDLIRLWTQNSEYCFTLLEPAAGQATVESRQLFPHPTTVVICGSGCGGTMLRVGWIGIGLQLEFNCSDSHGRPLRIITSPIKRLMLERPRH